MAVRLTKVDIETSLSNGPSGSSNGTTNKTSRRPSWPNGHYSPDGPIQDLFNNKGTFQSSFCHSKKISSYVNAVQSNSKHQGSQDGHELRPGLQRPSSTEDVNKIGIFEKAELPITDTLCRTLQNLEEKQNSSFQFFFKQNQEEKKSKSQGDRMQVFQARNTSSKTSSDIPIKSSNCADSTVISS